MERRLSAIFAADMVGYSRLVEADELGTLERQRVHRNEILDPFFKKFHGRIVKEMGDGLLVEFSSVIDAVQCAVAIQTAMNERETDMPDSRRISYRIGINLGDIVVENGDLYGDGVNVAARLEQLASPGGICISATVYDHLRNHLSVGYEDLGYVRVKNIERPIRVYRLHFGEDHSPSRLTGRSRFGSKSHWSSYVSASVLLLALAMVGSWFWMHSRDLKGTKDSQLQTTVEVPNNLQQASVAVLPFTNKSTQSDQLFFADGITDEITINLTKVPGLLVLARDSSFVFRDEKSDTKQIANALGARYLLRGSVRREEQDIRITASLVEGKTGQVVWADRYDTKLERVFDLQTKIAETIVSELSKEFQSVGKPVSRKRATDDLLAYDLFLKGRELFYRFSRESTFKARTYFEKAYGRDANFAECLAMLAWTYAFEYNNGWAADSNSALDTAFELTKKATQLNDQLPIAHFVRALVHRERREYIEAMGEAQRAIEADPNYANAYIMLATLLYYGGRPKEGLSMVEKAEKINPYHPSNYPFHKGQALFILQKYKEAEVVLRRGLNQNPTSQRLRVWLAATLVELGRLTDAEWEVDQILLDDPDFNQASLHHVFPFTDKEAENRFYGALQKAGFDHRF